MVLVRVGTDHGGRFDFLELLVELKDPVFGTEEPLMPRKESSVLCSLGLSPVVDLER